MSIHAVAGVQHHPVVQVERTNESSSYLLRIASHGSAWLAAGSYDATITGTQEVNGSLALADYDVRDDGLMFSGLFSIGDDPAE